MIHLVSGKALVAKLIPMRPILCVVLGEVPSVMGLALTDPYLGSARPLLEHCCGTASTKTVNDVLHCAIRLCKPGGLAFALPMNDHSKSPATRTNDDELVLYQRAAFLRQLRGVPLNQTMSDSMMACFIDERLTVDEACQMALCEVEQWEVVVDLLEERKRNGPRQLSLDAAVALNQFLWTHTGGWRNTFG